MISKVDNLGEVLSSLLTSSSEDFSPTGIVDFRPSDESCLFFYEPSDVATLSEMCPDLRKVCLGNHQGSAETRQVVTKEVVVTVRTRIKTSVSTLTGPAPCF